jgi:hypothetical protein
MWQRSHAGNNSREMINFCVLRGHRSPFELNFFSPKKKLRRAKATQS